MTRAVSVLVLALATTVAGLVVASPSSAAPIPVAYTLTAGDPALTTSLGTDSAGPCVAGSDSGTFNYKVVRFRVSATGTYAVADGGAGDARVGIYSGAFDPAAPLTNCLAFMDVTVDVALTAGTTYTMVQSTGTTATTGAFSVTFDGAGSPTVLASTTTTLTTTPNPSELSKRTTLRAVVAGGATPTGSVQFKEGAKVLGSATLSGGVAQLAVTSFAVGNHTLTATYLGDAAHEGSVDTHVHKVKFGPKPTLKLSVNDKSVYVGDTVKLTWVAKRADKVKASGDWKGTRPQKGTKKVKIKSRGFHVFKLKAKNVNGFVKAKVKVEALRAPKDFIVTVPDDVLTRNTKVRVKATRLAADEKFKVLLDDDVLARGVADKKGRVSALVLIPGKTPEGEHTISVVGSNDARLGTVDVLVVVPKALDVEVTKDKVKPNRNNTVKVVGLVAGEDVTVTYNGEVLVEGVADAQGKYEYTFDVGDESGMKTVEVVGAVPSRNGEDTFEVLAGNGPDV